MNAARALPLPRPAPALFPVPAAQAPQQAPRAPAVPELASAIPAELLALFEESGKMKASFWRLDDRDRRGFLRYIEEAKTPVIRERRAAMIAMSLMGLARDIPDEQR